MRKYLAKRLLLFPPTLFAISIFIFVLIRVVPGDVAKLILAGPEMDIRKGDEAALQAIRYEYGLDRPLYVQYVSWMSGVVRLDLGESLITRRPVTKVIRSRLPVTLQLTGMATGITLILAIPFGILAGNRQNTKIDYALRGVWALGLGMPTFWTSISIILLLAFVFDWTPPPLFPQFHKDPIGNLSVMIWPASVLGFYHTAIIARLTRSGVLEVLRADFVRTARAKGLKSNTIQRRHVLPVAMLPIMTFVGLQTGAMIGGSVVVETIFGLPGIGRTLYQSIILRDYLLLGGIVLLIALAYALINLMVDILYTWVDPRVRYK